MATEEDPSTTSDETTSDHILSICRRIMRCISQRDWTHPDWTELVAADYTCTPHFNWADTHSRADFIEVYIAYLRDYPEYRSEPLRMEVQFDENHGAGTVLKASVWLFKNVFVYATPLKKESVVLIGLEKREGRWILVSEARLRGNLL